MATELDLRRELVEQANEILRILKELHDTVGGSLWGKLATEAEALHSDLNTAEAAMYKFQNAALSHY